MSERQNPEKETLIGQRIAYDTRKYGDKLTYTVKDVEGGEGKPWILHLEDSQGVTRPLPIQEHGFLKLCSLGFWAGWKVRKNDNM